MRYYSNSSHAVLHAIADLYELIQHHPDWERVKAELDEHKHKRDFISGLCARDFVSDPKRIAKLKKQAERKAQVDA